MGDIPSDETELLVLRASGPATDGGRLPLAELARLAGGLQAALEQVALSIEGHTPRPGRRPREIVDAMRLDFVGFHAGSAQLSLARGRRNSSDDRLFTRAMDAFANGITALRADPSVRPVHFGPPLINTLRDLTGSIGTGNLLKVELRQGSVTRFVLDEGIQTAVRTVSFEHATQGATIVGRLHMGDFPPAALRCRIDTFAGSVACEFDSDLRALVLGAMDQVVAATGEAELEPDGSRIRILHLTSLRRVDSARPKSFDELAYEQGIVPVASAADLRATPMHDNELEEFLAILRSAREEGT